MDEQLVEMLRKATGAEGPIRLALTDTKTDETWVTTIESPYAVIGRSSNCDVTLDCAKVSSRHAYLQVVNGNVFCVDLGSRNGTHWAGGPRRADWLVPGRRARIGSFSLEVEPDDPFAGKSSEFSLGNLNPLNRYEDECGPLPEVDLEFLREDGENRFWAVSRMLTLAGKVSGCKIRIAGGNPRVHCSLLRTSQGLWVIDLLSRNTVSVDGQQVACHLLEDGEVLDVQNYRMRIHYTGPSFSESSNASEDSIYDDQLSLSGVDELPPFPDVEEVDESSLKPVEEPPDIVLPGGVSPSASEYSHAEFVSDVAAVNEVSHSASGVSKLAHAALDEQWELLQKQQRQFEKESQSEREKLQEAQLLLRDEKQELADIREELQTEHDKRLEELTERLEELGRERTQFEEEKQQFQAEHEKFLAEQLNFGEELAGIEAKREAALVGVSQSEEAQKEIAELRAKFEEERKQFEAAQKEAEQTQADLKNQFAKLSTQSQDLEAEKTELQQKREELETELAQFRQEQQAALDKSAEDEKSRGEAVELQQLQQQRLQEDRDALETQMADWEKQKSDLDQQRADLEQQRTEAQRRDEELSQREQQIADEVEKQAADRKELEQQQAQAQELRETLQREKSEFQKEMETHQAQQAQASSEAADVQQLQSQLQEERTALESRADEVDRRAGELDGQRAEIEQARSEFDQQQSDFTAQQSELESRQQELDQQQQALAADREALDRQQGELQAQRDELRRDTDAFNEKVTQQDFAADATVDASELDELNQQRSALEDERRQLDSQKQEWERTRAEFDEQTAKLAADQQALQSQIQQLSSDREALDAQRNKLHVEQQALQEQRDKLAAAPPPVAPEISSEEREKLEQERQQLAAARSQFDQQQSDLERRNSDLTAREEQLTAGQNSLLKDRESLNDAQQKLDADRDKLRTDQQHFNAEVLKFEMGHDVNASGDQEQFEKLKNELAQSQSTQARLSEEKQKLEQELAALRAAPVAAASPGDPEFAQQQEQFLAEQQRFREAVQAFQNDKARAEQEQHQQATELVFEREHLEGEKGKLQEAHRRFQADVQHFQNEQQRFRDAIASFRAERERFEREKQGLPDAPPVAGDSGEAKPDQMPSDVPPVG